MRASTLLLLTLAGLALLAPSAAAPHLYRNGGGGCTPADGALGEPGGPGATVLMLHNSYLDLRTATPVTIIAAGESVTWVWSSAHCHSATDGLPTQPGTAFDTGFHYPAQVPEGPLVLPGFFDYPVPDLTPTLSSTHTFDAPGVYPYFCVHHFTIGMYGVVVVQ